MTHSYSICLLIPVDLISTDVAWNYLLRCVITGSTGILPKTYLKNIPKIFQEYFKNILKIFMQNSQALNKEN
jgi:hypothetical protein